MLETIKNILSGYIRSSDNIFIWQYRLIKKRAFIKKYINRCISDVKYDYDGVHYLCEIYHHLKNKVNLDSIYENDDDDKYELTRIFIGINSISISAAVSLDGYNEAVYMITFFNDTDKVRVMKTNKTELGHESRSYDIIAPIVKEDDNDIEYLIITAFVIVVQRFIIEYLKV